MIHDLYLRAHVVVCGNTSDEAEQSPQRTRSPKLWPDYALVLDTETTLDLEQTLNFGVWRFCHLQATEYVAVQEGIFYRDGLSRKDLRTILASRRDHLAVGLIHNADRELAVLSRAVFVERIFWESVRAGALIVGFNLSFDISRIRVRWTVARNGGFSFVLSQLNDKQVENLHRPRIRIAPLNGVAERFELTAVRRKGEQRRWRRGRFLDLHTLAFALTDNSYSLAGAIQAFGSRPEKMEYEPTGRITELGNFAPTAVLGQRSTACRRGFCVSWRLTSGRDIHRIFRFDFPVNSQHMPKRLSGQWPVRFSAFRASGAHGKVQSYHL
jgi:hypothetical protein